MRRKSGQFVKKRSWQVSEQEVALRHRQLARGFAGQQLSVGPHPALHGNSDTEQGAGLLWLKEAKQSSFDDGWRQRWFVHDAGALFWFNSSPTTTPRGSIELSSVVIDEQREAKEKGRFLLVAPKRSYELRAEDEEAKRSWTVALRKMSHLKAYAESNQQMPAPEPVCVHGACVEEGAQSQSTRVERRRPHLL